MLLRVLAQLRSCTLARRQLCTAHGGTSMRLPILNALEAISRWQTAVPPQAAASVLASYSSVLGGIVTDPALMLLPMDDHGFHRGHCVFDTCNVEDGKAFGLTMHLNRLLVSARKARIISDSAPPPAGFDKDSLRSIILQTIAASGRRDGIFVRYWLSVGRGDFAISPKQCASNGGLTFYCVVHLDSHSAAEPRGVAAAVVPVPLKPPLLATMKSNNYLLNALVAMEAEARNATLGVQLDNGFVAESAVSTIAIVDGEGKLRAPPADRILDSTTWRRTSELAPSLVDAGILAGVSATPVSEAELREAREILSLGGGWVEPVLTLDGQAVGDGLPGPVFRALDPVVRADFLNPEHTDDVPYL